jgi:hypothetical protein
MSKDVKIAWQQARTACKMSEHLLQHGIQVVLNSPGDMETGIFIQQADAAYKFTHRV